jgi:polysaccharide export outer membrane protein
MTCPRHICSRRLRLTPVAALLVLTGCASRYDDLKVFVQQHEQDVAVSEYVIEPPDGLAIESSTCPELQNQEQLVAPDGKVTLPLLGEVKVADMTPREVAARLKELLSVYYTDPEVTVRVVAHASKKLFVFGEASSTGAIPFTGRDTVLDVLAQCRMSRYAWGARVKIIRPGPSDKERHEIVVDVDHMMQTGDTRGNVLLQEGDIIYVPPTPLAWAGMRIQDVLFPFQSAAQAYSVPAAFMGTTDYYKDRGSAKTTFRLSPSGIGAALP